MKYISSEYFSDVVKELFLEYLPKIKAADRKTFTEALIQELEGMEVEFEHDYEDSEDFQDHELEELTSEEEPF